MANRVISTPYFERRLKRLHKKFPTLYNELDELESQLLKFPTMGIDYGANIYKIKLACKSKHRGKSGGFRVITYLIQQTEAGYEINLVTIYDKSEEANITKEDILKLVKKIYD